MPLEMTIDSIPSLKGKHVYMKNKDAVLKTIDKIREGGASKLQVVTDFDLTLTKQHVDGKHCLSSFGMFTKSKQLPQNYKEASVRLYKKYRPIEIDPNLSIEKKIEAMEEWMSATHDILRDFEFDPKELDDIVKIHGTSLRDGTKSLIERLSRADVPILVFSAGLGDVVEAVLRHHDVLFDNVKIISNFLKYEGNKVLGFKGTRLIHVFNKNEHSIDHDYFKLLEGRRNIILMGDMTGDANMADGVKDVDSILKIGFLYEHIEENLPLYLEAFDIVLVDDQTMNVTTEILERIV
ncbi:7-methylguanosine phosphate-specific 5'-nucleotidase isoform X1 [Venturia canescens]|uniref:7-methylguanosine phosphate-specific 5'-nucleotidase isoform X1 n=1 Tax=Venturia canescens TaxID=32260 RepID=UPI001C9D01D9|nr:7-methylguanosine phosphate-specific 5'-nucleotidase isoform X1 [Venturia canescens]